MQGRSAGEVANLSNAARQRLHHCEVQTSQVRSLHLLARQGFDASQKAFGGVRSGLTVMVRVDHAGHHDAVLHVQHQIRLLAARGEVRRGPHPADHIALDVHGRIADLPEIGTVCRQQLDVLQEDGPRWDRPDGTGSTHEIPAVGAQRQCASRGSGYTRLITS